MDDEAQLEVTSVTVLCYGHLAGYVQDDGDGWEAVWAGGDMDTRFEVVSLDAGVLLLRTLTAIAATIANGGDLDATIATLEQLRTEQT